MKLTSKGRYAVTAMIDIALNQARANHFSFDIAAPGYFFIVS